MYTKKPMQKAGSISYLPLPPVPLEGLDVGELDLVGGGAAGEAGLAKDDLPVDGAGHQLHRAGIGPDGVAERGQVGTYVPFGRRAEGHFELLQAMAEDVVELVWGEVLEDEGMVELIDSGV